jgi:hypothetical protein
MQQCELEKVLYFYNIRINFYFNPKNLPIGITKKVSIIFSEKSFNRNQVILSQNVHFASTFALTTS